MSEKNPFEGLPLSEQPERELTPEELREKLRDPSYLPTHKDISRVFKFEGFFSGEWHDFCFDEESPVFEFLNEEFLNSFGDYLSQRAENLGATEDEPITILEVGAGNGRLTHFLRQKLEQRMHGKVKIIATDSGEWELKTAFPVEQLDHKAAIEKYQPKIVVFSWMPCEDSSADFRSAESVEEYILIGEADGGCCGDEWYTWGLSWSFDDEEREKREKQPDPNEADGFERIYVGEVAEHQICRTDEPGHYYHSRTVSFRRKK